MFLSDFLVYLCYYIFVGIIFALVSAFFAGFNGNVMTKDDYISSIFWPISIATLLGLLIKLYFQKKDNA